MATTRRSSTATHFRIHADLDAWEGDQRIFCRSYDRLIPRDCV